MSPRQSELDMLKRGGGRLSARAVQAADDEALAAGIAASRVSTPSMDGRSELQARIDSARAAGVFVSAGAVQRANDAALAAAMAASLPSSPRTDARSELQSRIESARSAGIPVSANAVQRANDAALAAAMAASVPSAAPAESSNEPEAPDGGIAPNSGAGQRAEDVAPDASTKAVPEASIALATPYAGGTPASHAASGAPASAGMPSSKAAEAAKTAASRQTPATVKDPYAALGVRKDAPWRVIFDMVGRVPPEVVKSRATTAEGVIKMMTKVAHARKDLSKAYKVRLIPIHPDRNLDKDMGPVVDIVNTALNEGEKELAATALFLELRLHELTTPA